MRFIVSVFVLQVKFEVCKLYVKLNSQIKKTEKENRQIANINIHSFHWILKEPENNHIHYKHLVPLELSQPNCCELGMSYLKSCQLLLYPRLHFTWNMSSIRNLLIFLNFLLTFRKFSNSL